MAANILAEVTQHLQARHLHPSPQWLQTFISGTRPNTPLPALKSTALFRLLATDITITLTPPPTSVFPADILNAKIQSRYLVDPVIVQVLDIEDIGHSRWSQVEAIEAKERGEMTKGREIVRIIPGENENENENGGNSEPAASSKGPFKMLLQDAKGVKLYAYDLRGIEGLNTGMSIGAKLVVRGVEVRRAVVMLEPGVVQILGGRIEALDKVWKDGRKERLMASARVGREEGVR